MKKTLKKITAMLLSALFMINLMPTSAFAAEKPTEPEIEPQDSGYFIYQYYDTCPAGWPDPNIHTDDDSDGWSSTSYNELIVISIPLMYIASSQLAAEIASQCPDLPDWVVSMAADGILDGATAIGSKVTSFNFSLTHITNNKRRPYQYLNYYSFDIFCYQDNVYELVTLN